MELADRVEQIAATIRELREASTDDGRNSRQLIDSLFRTVHTFKAAAAAEGLIDLSRTAHEFENLLHSLRTGKVTLDPEVLRVCDETVAALRNGSESVALNRFNVATRGATTADGRLPPDFANLKEDERHRALTALREGANLYAINVEFEASDFDERFRQLKERLEEVAEIVSVSPTMQNDQIIFKVVYASNSEKLPVRTVLQQAVLAGKSAAARLNKEVDFVVEGDEVLLDRPLSDALTNALLHLVRNAVDHGIESQGRVSLATQRSAEKLRVFVTDNGRGIDPAKLPLLFQPGFSTATEVSEISGRGVGLDVVKSAVEAAGGTVNVMSVPGKFTSFVLTLPNPSSDA